MSKKILLVEYDSELVEQINQFLRHELFDVTTAGDGTVARILLAKKGFDLVITEAMLPKSHGFVLSRFIADNHPETKVLIIGEKREGSNYLEEALQHGADGFYEKPLQEALFRQKVMEILNIKVATLYENKNPDSTNLMVLPLLEEVSKKYKKPEKSDSFDDILKNVGENNDPYEINLDDSV